MAWDMNLLKATTLPTSCTSFVFLSSYVSIMVFTFSGFASISC